MSDRGRSWRLTVPLQQPAALALANGLELSAARIALGTGRIELLEVAARLRGEALRIRVSVAQRERARSRRQRAARTRELQA
jgi:hypothetical protein